MSLPDKTKLFQEVENWLSMSMPLLGLTINGKEYNFTGMTIMDDDNENEKNDSGWNKNALEILMFPKQIWRQNGWISHNGIEDAIDIIDITSSG